jgi:hypothetical protein
MFRRDVIECLCALAQSVSQPQVIGEDLAGELFLALELPRAEPNRQSDLSLCELLCVATA